MKVIATLKFNQRSRDSAEWAGKQGGSCPLNHKHCTDVTGAHHSKIVEGENLTNIWMRLNAEGCHVTRLEVIEE